MQIVMAAVARRRIRAVAPVVVVWPAMMLLAPGSAFAVMNWQQKSPATSPSVRASAPLVWDALHKQVVMFGGFDLAGKLGDTWVWDGTNWTQKSPSTSPSARFGHAMAWDAAHNQVVLFGGKNNTTSLNDTWVWDGSNWTQMSPSSSPSPRENPGVAWDATHNRLVLFGGETNDGQGNFTYFNDTWVWDGANWTQMSPSASPSSRTQVGMAWDAARNQVVAFGGYFSDGFNSTIYNDTWVWDGATWTQKSPVASPPARAWFKMAYDEARSQTVIFGGYNNSDALPTDTWVWDGTNWIQQSPLVSPGGQQGPGMAYDEVHQQVVTFGGQTFTTDINETWIWYDVPSVNITITSAQTAATFSVSGSDCQAGSAYTVPQTLQWGPGSTCTVTFESLVSGGTGVQSVFTGWADDVADNPRTITTPSGDATYTANYKTQYLLSTAVVAAGAGSATGAGSMTRTPRQAWWRRAPQATYLPAGRPRCLRTPLHPL